jgi:ElaB/YqjD/DUF883 family membrane-anchored ribosome-binding protein
MATAEQERTNSCSETAEEVRDLRKMEVQAATQAGANATQAATHAGTWSAMIAGVAGLVVGMLLSMAIVAAARRP